MTEHKYNNKLLQEKSPYLLQHAHNPVDWYPWGPEAFARAVSEDKPIFLSIGYSTCHWCHVMERESFEDEEVAALLNKSFISIKVDREERPDIDSIYMTVCQALTGRGGWPLNIFLSPERKPFYAGTYFPKGDRMGMTGLMSLLDSISDAWKNNREALLDSGDKIIHAISIDEEHDAEIPETLFSEAFSQFKYDFDSVYGGFGRAPKFPAPHNLFFLLRYYHMTGDEYTLEMVEDTLDSMYRGGIYDHVGFGFSRYSTDRKWLIPHFEKMLYDNALLAIAYLEAHQITGKELYGRAARKIFEYVLRDMTSPEGGFYSAEDADSEGVEGKFYIWSRDEVLKVLGSDDGEKYCQMYDITAGGNFEGYNIPNLIKSGLVDQDYDLAEKCRQKLFEHREKRIHPYKDDKILTSWNGLMIAALAMGGRVLGDQRYLDAARKAADFILDRLVRHDGRLMARFRDNHIAYPAYIDDYAFFVWGLIELYQSVYDPHYLAKATALTDNMLQLFWDREHGGLFLYGSDSEQLIIRPKEVYDGATPSGNSAAAMNLLKLARLTGRNDFEERAHKIFEAFSGQLTGIPRGHTYLLSALAFARSAGKEVVISGNAVEAAPLVATLKKGFNPFTVSLLYTPQHSGLEAVVPFIADYKPTDGKAAAYVCHNFTCSAPVTDAEALSKALLQ